MTSSVSRRSRVGDHQQIPSLQARCHRRSRLRHHGPSARRGKTLLGQLVLLADTEKVRREQHTFWGGSLRQWHVEVEVVVAVGVAGPVILRRVCTGDLVGQDSLPNAHLCILRQAFVHPDIAVIDVEVVEVEVPGDDRAFSDGTGHGAQCSTGG